MYVHIKHYYRIIHLHLHALTSVCNVHMHTNVWTWVGGGVQRIEFVIYTIIHLQFSFDFCSIINNKRALLLALRSAIHNQLWLSNYQHYIVKTEKN